MNYIAIAHSAHCELPTFDDELGVVNAVITAPRGSWCQQKFDTNLRDFVVDERLPAGVVFPFDYGFIPSTESGDGSPLEVMVFLEEPSTVGAVLPTRLIGVIQSEETEAGRVVRKSRLLAVLETSYNPSRLNNLSDLDPHLIARVEHFFMRVSAQRGRLSRCVAHGGAEQALRLVQQSKLGADQPLDCGGNWAA